MYGPTGPAPSSTLIGSRGNMGPNPTTARVVNGQIQINTPIGQVSNPLDLVNSINTLINTDAAWIKAWAKDNGPLVVIAIILLAVMLIAAREFIKE
jgi:hypothetical protein